VTLATFETSEAEAYFDIDEHFPFWHETGRSIYIRKVGSLAQSIELFRRASETAIEDPYQFLTNPLRSIYEMLTTVSLANISIDPCLRGHIFRFLVSYFATKFTENNALNVVASHLSKHLERSEVSDTALLCMLQELNAKLGPTHPICFRAQSANVRLLRRKRDYESAYHAGYELLKFARTHFGVHSENARRAAREFENVLMELGEWAEALSICFSVVGQEIEDVGKAKPAYRDKCAIYVMQDIAKCYQNLGQVEKMMSWLQQALNASVHEWGEDASVTQHIRDKFVAVAQGGVVGW
jgi:tetratricopeptide (TPR) repeat protein